MTYSNCLAAGFRQETQQFFLLLLLWGNLLGICSCLLSTFVVLKRIFKKKKKLTVSVSVLFDSLRPSLFQGPTCVATASG